MKPLRLALLGPVAFGTLLAGGPFASTDTAVPDPTAQRATAVAASVITPTLTLPVRGLLDAHYTPSSVESLYGVTAADLAAADPAGTPTGGPTVAVVVAGRDADLDSELATYRSTFGLSACTEANGCLAEYDEAGRPVDADAPATAQPGDWNVETPLDVEAVSATCPACRIDVVEAGASDEGDLDMAANAAAEKLGAEWVSMSWTAPTWSAPEGHWYDDASTVFVAASGDDGREEALWPAADPHVVAVGGTSVPLADPAAVSAWSDATAGCQNVFVAPAGEPAAAKAACDGHRAVTDVSALADPQTGFDAYTAGDGWEVVGGTSLAAPIVTSLYALSGNHTEPYAFVTNAATDPGLIADVTTGAQSGCAAGDVVCQAGPGWDGPTGLGTPTSPALFATTPTTTATIAPAPSGAAKPGRTTKTKATKTKATKPKATKPAKAKRHRKPVRPAQG